MVSLFGVGLPRWSAGWQQVGVCKIWGSPTWEMGTLCTPIQVQHVVNENSFAIALQACLWCSVSVTRLDKMAVMTKDMDILIYINPVLPLHILIGNLNLIASPEMTWSFRMWTSRLFSFRGQSNILLQMAALRARTEELYLKGHVEPNLVDGFPSTKLSLEFSQNFN